MEEKTREYASLSARQSLSLEMGVPENKDEANRLFDDLFAPYQDENLPVNLPADPQAVVMPHIDLERGRRAYGLIERALAAAPPADVYVILGVNHNFISDNPFIVTDRAYESPLGRLDVDKEMLDALKGRIDWDPLKDQVAHSGEHSIEFPSILLRRLYPTAPITILPILSNFPDCNDNRIKQFIDALKEVIEQCGKRVFIISSVDFSHVGPMFGAEKEVEEKDLVSIESRDRKTLELLAAGDAKAFWQDIMYDENSRNIDATQSCYVMLQLLGENARGHLIEYEQAFDPFNTVTFATVVFRGAA
jgi:AmmeMemoRadiSam system protein B